MDLLRIISFRQSDVKTSLEIIVAICNEFDQGFAELAEATWRESRISNSIDNKEVVEVTNKLVHDSIQQESFLLAESILSFAESLSSDEYPLQQQELKRTREELKEAVELSKQAQVAMDKIRQNDKDSKANGAIGSFLCFVRQDFRQGLPYLLRSDVTIIKDLAMRDLLTNQNARPHLRLSRAWLEMSQTNSGIAKRAMLNRANYWNSKVESRPANLM
jgi:hypothetical protein